MVRITFNNHRNNRDSKNQKSMFLNIDNCKITNYNPDKKTPQEAGDLTLSIVDGKKNYKRGNSLFNNSDVELNETKYSIFERLAIQDGKSNDLTEEDISLAKRNFRKGCTLWQLGVINIDYNPNDGKAVINIKGDEVLYIDFETKKEHEERVSKNKKTEQVSSKQTSQSQVIPDKTAIENELCKLAGKKKIDELNLADLQKIRANSIGNLTKLGVEKIAIDSDSGIANVYVKNSKDPFIHFEFKHVAKTKTATTAGIKKLTPMEELYNSIPKEYDTYIKKAAKEAGVTENFIRHLIFSEGDNKTKKAKLTPYYCKNGVLTVGFGHTNLTDNSKGKNGNKVVKGKSITLQEAFDYLVADIKEHRRYAKHYIGEEKFDKLDAAVQEGLIDRSFQAGQGGFRGATIKANIQKNVITAVVARNLWVSSDIRRSAMRFLMVISGMKKEEQCSAKQRFENLGYYTKVINFFKEPEKTRFINAYNSFG